MTFERLSTGRQGEELAARYLEGKGLLILERNLRTPLGELDLVARDGRTLVFVEVKSRRGTSFGVPQEAVGPRKQRQILRSALWYLAGRKLGEPLMRFDVVAVQFGRAGARIEHIPGAFGA